MISSRGYTVHGIYMRVAWDSLSTTPLGWGGGGVRVGLGSKKKTLGLSEEAICRWESTSL